MVQEKINVFWFRRDLRLNDNTALYHALQSGKKVLLLFIFDVEILSHLPKNDRRVAFIHQELAQINEQLKKYQTSIYCFHKNPLQAFEELTKQYIIDKVFCNHDYEPKAIARDNEVISFLENHLIGFESYKDQVIFEKHDVIKSDNYPYTVYTPYSKKWRAKLAEEPFQQLASEDCLSQVFLINKDLPSLESLGFEKVNHCFSPKNISFSLLKDYHLKRDFPALNAGSQLSIHLRFGTISVRELVLKAIETNDTWLSELIWREFFMQIIYHFPHVEKQSFRAKYDQIVWENDEEKFEKWCQGKTGYPLVDAGMRELNATGNMHNRVRMVVASFLCKHLLIDWRWGEAYFAMHLNDYDLSANNGNWQWAAGCGCDAAPYFRVFNPTIQAEKFDKNGEYIRKWVEDLSELSYPAPIVNHAIARDKAIATYKKYLDVN